MNCRLNFWKQAFFGVALTASLTSISCQQAAAPPQPAAPAAQTQHLENGRYQIFVSNEGDRGAVLFLLDSRDGGTWIYRPPQPPAFNGFWSDIPRLTYPPETWQQVFQTMVQQAQQAQQPAGGTRPTPPAPATPSR